MVCGAENQAQIGGPRTPSALPQPGEQGETGLFEEKGHNSDGSGSQFEAELLGFALQVLDRAFTGAFFVVAFARVPIGCMVLEHGIDDACQLVGGGRNALGFAELGLHVAAVAAQGAVTVGEALRRHAQGRGGTVLTLARVTFDHLAARLVILGTNAQPRRKVLAGRPGTHVHAGLRQDFVDGERIQPINGGQVHARELVEVFPQVKLGRILLWLTPLPFAGR